MNNNYLKNLPKSDSNDELEDISLAAINSFLPKDKFYLRDARVKDKGVDATLEIKTNGLSTNFNAHIQLKSTRQQTINKDGTISLSVKTSNLNYLLNFPISLYILYIEPRQEFRFAWADKELKRVTEENPNWENKKTVTIKFSEILDANNLQQIHQQIIEKGSLTRSVNTSLLFSNSSNVVLEIDLSSLEVNDSNKIKELLIKAGLTWIFYGHGQTVLDKINLLNSQDKELPYIQILAAFAEYELGHYTIAKHLLVSLRIYGKQLSDSEQLMASYIEANCDYQTGRIDIEKYTAKLKDLAYKEVSEKIPFKIYLSYLRFAILIEKDISKRRVLLEELRQEIEKDIPENSTKEVDLYHKYLLLEAEGQQIDLEFSKDAGNFVLKCGLGFYSSPYQFYEPHYNNLVKWLEKLADISQKTKSETLIADILCLRARINILWQSPLLLLAKYTNFLFDNRELLNALKKDLTSAIDVYERNKLKESELRAKNYLVDILTFERNHDEASNITSNISALADDLSYANIKYVSENPFSKGVIEVANRKDDSDVSILNLSDETIKLYAQQRLEALKLPDSRLPNIETNLFAERDIAQERFNWCQHIELEQNTLHTLSLSTYFAINPSRRSRCRIHPYISTIISPNWKDVILNFKKTYCEKCPDRKPKAS